MISLKEGIKCFKTRDFSFWLCFISCLLPVGFLEPSRHQLTFLCSFFNRSKLGFSCCPMNFFAQKYRTSSKACRVQSCNKIFFFGQFFFLTHFLKRPLKPPRFREMARPLIFRLSRRTRVEKKRDKVSNGN